MPNPGWSGPRVIPDIRTCRTAEGGGWEGRNVEFCQIGTSPRLCTIEQCDGAAETIVVLVSCNKAAVNGCSTQGTNRRREFASGR